MSVLMRHLSKCMVAGVVAMLPIGGLILTVVSFELMISDSWLAAQPWYLPGMGIVVALGLVYTIGLAVTTVVGKWLWGVLDRTLQRLPLLGQLYATLKQVLGYGEGEGAVFREVVLVPSREQEGMELGLVTDRVVDDATGRERLSVFLPTSPNPGNGRLVFMDAASVTPSDARVSDALRTLVSAGATRLQRTEPADGAAWASMS